MQGIIFETERWSLNDGPGTRTVVFLKGCPLRCQWCANPESQSSSPQIGIFTQKCIECQNCTNICKTKVARPALQGGFTQDTPCTSCGECIVSCPSRSRRWMGSEVSGNEIVEIIKKDSLFYRKSGGGVTFSGGEPFQQPDFLHEMLAGCKKAGIHTAVESCGVFSFAKIHKCIDLIDFILLDLKHMDGELHRNLTGSSNKIILENSIKLSTSGIPIVIRIPVIPTINDSAENIRATAVFVRDYLPTALGIEPLPYHRLGLTKYSALGMEYNLHNIPVPNEKDMDLIQKLINSEGIPCIGKDTGYDTSSGKPVLKLLG